MRSGPFDCAGAYDRTSERRVERGRAGAAGLRRRLAPVHRAGGRAPAASVWRVRRRPDLLPSSAAVSSPSNPTARRPRQRGSGSSVTTERRAPVERLFGDDSGLLARGRWLAPRRVGEGRNLLVRVPVARVAVLAGPLDGLAELEQLVPRPWRRWRRAPARPRRGGRVPPCGTPAGPWRCWPSSPPVPAPRRAPRTSLRAGRRGRPGVISRFDGFHQRDRAAPRLEPLLVVSRPRFHRALPRNPPSSPPATRRRPPDRR